MSLRLQNPHPHHKQTPVTTGKVFKSHTYTDIDDDIVSRVIPITLDLFSNQQSPLRLKFESGFLNSKSKQKRGLEEEEETMSRRGGPKKLDLKLNLSPPPPPRGESSASPSASVSPPDSCVSSEEDGGGGTSGASMVLAGCPRCLMYVMLSEHDPKCPKCHNTVLLDFVRNNNNNNNNNKKSYGGTSKKTRKN